MDAETNWVIGNGTRFLEQIERERKKEHGELSWWDQ